MKAEVFLIKGSFNLLKAIMEELTGIGYKNLGTDDKGKFICQGHAALTYNCTDKKSRFSDIGIYDQALPRFDFKYSIFELPQQYNEALEFAAEQLKDKYWVQTPVFIKGKWYRNSEKTFAKCSETTYEDQFNFQEWIIDGVFKKENKYWGKHREMREATLEEIQQYLPDGHVDKITPNKWDIGTFVVFCEDIWEYKKGDIDVITKAPLINYDNMSLKQDNCVSISREKEGTFNWFAARKEAEEFVETLKLKQPVVTKLPFGNLEFTIHKGDNHAHCSQGIVYKKEIQEIVDWFNKPFNLLGYEMNIHNEGKWYIRFGCCEGTISEIKAILKAFD